MSGYLGPALKAITMGRGAVLQGRDRTAELEQEAKMMKLRMALQMPQRKTQEQEKWETRETENGLVQVHPLTGEVRPVQMGGQTLKGKSPAANTPSLQHIATEEGIMLLDPKTGEMRPAQVGGKTVKPPPQKWQVYGPGSGGQDGGVGTWSVQQTDEGLIQVNNKTGETRPVMAPGGGVARKPMDATTKAKVSANKAQSHAITQALGSLVNNRQAVGVERGRGIMDAIDQRVDPKGVDTRALIANVSSLVIHDRSGANVTVGEAPRLKPFIPSIRDEPEAIVTKLRRLRELIEEETRGMEEFNGGAAPSPAPANEFGPGGGEPNDFTRASALLQKQHDAAIARGVDPRMAAGVYEREMAKLRKRSPRVR